MIPLGSWHAKIWNRTTGAKAESTFSRYPSHFLQDVPSQSITTFHHTSPAALVNLKGCGRTKEAVYCSRPSIRTKIRLHPTRCLSIEHSGVRIRDLTDIRGIGHCGKFR